ncbi:4-diphosphocytidyl-2C-methyl-D-erythritol kinase [Roseivivax halodurans JCM 10272]|uniref:4-diphosphocytidyl-2-C-methyl-D-erythritol kinase n=1 Tax=Roseivivax halodurans JCM 10272 TaxID=1449350 RepID=X7EIU1_9RHOB|nr:4-(cytidine 5'-diphospho)-2-C-methyl-D-erythritol kinase [Roseivivax halodurans]ETX15086.1 4-diphosphocytidyl-2C-methyl-D-erythritol kinase [Roseivivax halodurans JCM 10272]
MSEHAPAKVNLTLHVTGRRSDGYHLLDSLVAFADVGDTVTAEPADALTLEVTGPMGADVPTGPENLVLAAARLFDAPRGARLILDKHLPAAAGIGGGSSDAAAALRLLSRLWDLPVPEGSVALGADVPMCLDPRVQRVRGVGDERRPVDILPPLPTVLVNPGVPVATPEVFKRLTVRENPPMPTDLPLLSCPADAADWIATQRNDLAGPARAIAPEIGAVLAALSGARLARMSGSGATCFGLYDTRAEADQAAEEIARAEPGWWVRATTLAAHAPSS